MINGTQREFCEECQVETTPPASLAADEIVVLTHAEWCPFKPGGDITFRPCRTCGHPFGVVNPDAFGPDCTGPQCNSYDMDRDVEWMFLPDSPDLIEGRPE